MPLLVLHGGPGTPHDYLEPLEGLADGGRPMVFYDQLGCGNSDQFQDPSLWSVGLFLEELATVRRELGLEHIHLLGHSWGGMLAIEYALTRPAGLVSLILSSSLASIPQWIAEANRLREELPQEAEETLCKCRISRRLSLLRVAARCTVLRSRWYQSGIKGSDIYSPTAGPIARARDFRSHNPRSSVSERCRTLHKPLI